MTNSVKIWIERDSGVDRAIRVDWDDDWHQRVKIDDATPQAMIRALRDTAQLINDRIANRRTK